MFRTRVAAIAMISIAATSSQADEMDARQILSNMAAYLAGQEALSFDFDSSLEVVTSENQKLAITSSGSIAMERPGKIHMTRRGGFATIEASFDGTTLSVANLEANVYAQIEVTGSIDVVIETLRVKYGHPVPGADLLSPNVADILMSDVTDVKDLGSGIIRGKECDHLAFRADAVDWQIWVSQGETPYPCRYMITTRETAGSPQYMLDISSWGAGSASREFAFTAAAGATRVDPENIPDLDEIAGIYVREGGN